MIAVTQSGLRVTRRRTGQVLRRGLRSFDWSSKVAWAVVVGERWLCGEGLIFCGAL